MTLGCIGILKSQRTLNDVKLSVTGSFLLEYLALQFGRSQLNRATPPKESGAKKAWCGWLHKSCACTCSQSLHGKRLAYVPTDRNYSLWRVITWNWLQFLEETASFGHQRASVESSLNSQTAPPSSSGLLSLPLALHAWLWFGSRQCSRCCLVAVALKQRGHPAALLWGQLV